MAVTLEQLTHENFRDAQRIDRDDIPEAWVDTAAALLETTDYGAAHHLLGHTYLARMDGVPVGLILIGEALAWDTDPEEMRGKPFYRVLGYVVDRQYRGRGIGGEILENAVRQVYREFGRRSLALGVHRDNARAGAFYKRHGFYSTGVYEGSDEYYLRILKEDGGIKMKSILIADTTREEREQIVAESIGNIEGLCDGCSPGLADMYQAYIDGRKELRDINMEFNARYTRCMAGAEKSECDFANS